MIFRSAWVAAVRSVLLQARGIRSTPSTRWASPARASSRAWTSTSTTMLVPSPPSPPPGALTSTSPRRCAAPRAKLPCRLSASPSHLAFGICPLSRVREFPRKCIHVSSGLGGARRGAPPTLTWHTVQCAAPQLPLRAASKSAWRGGCRTLPGPVQLHHGPGAAAHRCVQNEQKGALCRRFCRGSERRMQQRRFCLPAYSKFLSAFMLQGDGQLAQSMKHYALGFPRLAAPSSPASSLT